MDEYTELTSQQNANYRNLAHWLQRVLTDPEESQQTIPEKDEFHPFEIPFEMHYHPGFYKQIPDFIMALLENDPHATSEYAPLLYHLVGCETCRAGYVELYEAMRAAMQPGITFTYVEPIVRPLSAINSRMLVQLSRLLISQAEALYYQGRHEQRDNDAEVRSLLQLAMRVSAHLTQQDARTQALGDLVRVAALAEGESGGSEPKPPALSFTSVPAEAGGVRQGHVVRHGETSKSGDEQAMIYLQANPFMGNIRQYEDTLELQLRDLNQSLRGHRLAISVPLGSLIEPVRWIGGNPRAILASSTVDERGMLVTPLGQTELRLSNPEERGLLAVLFSLLEVRIAD